MSRVIFASMTIGLVAIASWAILFPAAAPEKQAQDEERLKASKQTVDQGMRMGPEPPTYQDVPAYELQIFSGGKELPQHVHEGERWVEGLPGEEFLIRVHAPDDCESCAAVCVDGLDVSNWQVCKHRATHCFQSSLDVKGYRLDTKSVSAFVFPRAEESLAKQRGMDDQIGIIRIGIERARECDEIPSTDPKASHPHGCLYQIPTPLMGDSGPSHPALAKGAGRTISSPQGHYKYTPNCLGYRNFATYRLRYDTAEGLCRRGLKTFCR